MLLGGAFLYPGSLGEGMWDEGGWSSRREKGGKQNYKEVADFYAVKYSPSKGAAWHWVLLRSSGKPKVGQWTVSFGDGLEGGGHVESFDLWGK